MIVAPFRKRFPARALFAALLPAVLLAASPAAAEDRWFDTVPIEHQGVRLAVFYPSVGSVRALAALRGRGLLDIPDLTVIGVYHEKEMTNYADAKAYVRDNGLDWIKFHSVGEDIAPADLFGPNACTPEYETIVRKADGAIFFGGPDIPPAVFGKKTLLLTEITDPFRHYFEVSAVHHFLGDGRSSRSRPLLESRPGFAVLGICLGFQTLNVGTGGTLVQDIWYEVYGRDTVEDVVRLGSERWHNNPFSRLRPELRNLTPYSFHSLSLETDGRFCRELGFKPSDHPRILSSHHQALGVLGRGWKIIARSRDGKIAEAIEHKAFPAVLGIQFHPEVRALYEDDPKYVERPDSPATSYQALLAAAPPSTEFHKKIWAWFAAALKTSAAGGTR